MQAVATNINYTTTLNACYTQLLNNSQKETALQKIASLLTQETNICWAAVTINNKIISSNTIAAFDFTIDDANALQFNQPLIAVTDIKVASLQEKIAAAGIQNFYAYQPNNLFNCTILLATNHLLAHDAVDAFIQPLHQAIINTLHKFDATENLYSRNEVFETSLAMLNQLLWEWNLQENSIKVMGFAPAIQISYPTNGKAMPINESFFYNIHPDDVNEVKKNIEAFLLKANQTTDETVYRIKSSEPHQYVWVKTRKTLLCNANGTPTIIVGTTTNINDLQQVALELEKHKQENKELVLQLQESNEKLNTILNSSKEIILTIDLQTGQIENVNNAIQVLGYTPEEWIGQYYTEWSLEKRKQFHEQLKHASESDTSIRSQQILFNTKDGRQAIPFEFSTSVFSFKEKKYLLCVLRDVRERLHYEQNITKVTQQLTYLINSIDDVYAIYNLTEKKYDFVSDNVEGFFGCSKEDFENHGLIWKEIIHIEDANSIIRQMEEVLKNKSRGEFFYRITTPFGETKMILEKITVGLDNNGNANRVYIVKTDYTHIENAEQSLIESERKFRFISENITDFISIIDNDGRFIYASPSAEKVIGYAPEELIGEGTIYIIHPDDVTTFIEDVLHKAVFYNKESNLRYRMLAKTGQYIWVETYFKPILDTKNQTTSIICSTRDVTEREQLMKDLEQALEKERELNELRAQFVSTASHQFRTPLTVIQSGVELMELYLEGIPEQKQKPFQKQFTKIQAEVNRLQDLMNDVLLLGRADARRTPYSPETKDLVVFCEELVESRYNNRYSADRKILISVTGKPQPVLFDPKLLDHALENILSNAYKYSEQGNIQLKINFEYEQVGIAISDKGIGIPESDLSNLFQPFYRAGNTTEIEGTGLGLSIVKEFIDKHGGQIFVVSELNKGTTVNIILPIQQNNIE